jgi:hypothetical protein
MITMVDKSNSELYFLRLETLQTKEIEIVEGRRQPAHLFRIYGAQRQAQPPRTRLHVWCRDELPVGGYSTPVAVAARG